MTLSRREFTRWAAVAGASAVIGFDPRSRSWVTRAQAQTRAFREIPPLDGELLLDEESRKAVAVDLSNLHHKVPAAVLRPGSVQDVVKMVQAGATRVGSSNSVNILQEATQMAGKR